MNEQQYPDEGEYSEEQEEGQYSEEDSLQDKYAPPGVRTSQHERDDISPNKKDGGPFLNQIDRKNSSSSLCIIDETEKCKQVISE